MVCFTPIALSAVVASSVSRKEEHPVNHTCKSPELIFQYFTISSGWLGFLAKETEAEQNGQRLERHTISLKGSLVFTRRLLQERKGGQMKIYARHSKLITLNISWNLSSDAAADVHPVSKLAESLPNSTKTSTTTKRGFLFPQGRLKIPLFEGFH